MKAADIANALDAHPVGRGWRAACPVHGGDSGSSFSISESPDGQVLVHCFAGCPQDAVIDALRARGLWETGHQTPPVSRAPAGRYDRNELLGETFHELHVLLQVIGARLGAVDPATPKHARVPMAAKKHWDDPWPRELMAVRRILKQLRTLYGEVGDV